MNGDLTSFIEEVTGDSHLRVENDLGDGYVRLRSAEAERRQARHDIRCSEDIIIELLRNARDAGARNIFLAVNREGAKRRIVMLDDGVGVPKTMQNQIFEPRVTSKLDSMHVDRWGVHGRGMALYSIRENSSKAYIACSAKGMGTALVVETDLDVLPEKSDQSSLPLLTNDADLGIQFRGPHNINRTVAEFTFEHRESCKVYMGSSIEIASTLFNFGLNTLSKHEAIFCEQSDNLPVCQKLAVANIPDQFVEIAQDLGMVFSQRSARRVLDGEIEPLKSLDLVYCFEQLFEKKEMLDENDRRKKGTGKDARSLKIAQEDLNDFSRGISSLFEDLAERYYLEPTSIPKITVSHDAIQVRIDISKLL